MSAHSTGLRTPIPDSEIASVHFFNGRLVTSGDLALEQESQRLADQRIGSAIGAGIVEGLGIEFVSTDTQNGTLLRVDAGSGITAKGSALKLETEVELRIAAPSQKTSTTSGKAVFCKCATAPIWSRSAPPPSGAYLLVLRPDRQERGKRSLVGTDLSHLGCDTDTIAAAVQFDLVPVDTSGIVADGPARLRHELAQRSLRQSTPGQDDVLPLALVHFAVDTRLSFLDMWAVRRTTGRSRQIMSRPFLAPHPDAKLAWRDLVGDIPDSLGEARLCQFQDELDTALSSGSGAIHSSDFLPLPPAGFLPLEHARLEWRDFLGSHAASVPETLPVLEPTLVGPIVAEAATRAPLDANSRVRVAKVAGRDLVVYYRESINRTVAAETWLDGKAAKLDSAWNVQTAIEQLNAKVETLRTIWLKPGPGWEKAIPSAGTKSNVDLDLRFTVGDYPCDKAVELSGYRHIAIHGAGRGSRIVSKTESALTIRNASSCLVEDVAFFSGAVCIGAETKNEEEESHPRLKGALGIVNIPTVHLENVFASCPGGSSLGASAISIHNLGNKVANPSHSTIRIVGCTALAGAGQQGILCVNPRGTALLRDNTVGLNPDAKADADTGSNTVWLTKIAEAMTGVSKSGSIADKTRNFLDRSLPDARNWMAKLLTNIEDDNKKTAANRVVAALKKSARKGNTNDLESRIVEFAAKLSNDYRRVLARGIVVAGQDVGNVTIEKNSVSSAAQGILVATSAPGDKGDPRSIESVAIRDNTIRMGDMTAASGGRYGILVGNAQCIRILSNQIEIGSQADHRAIEGIRLFGWIGRFVRITDNRISGAEPGILFRHVPDRWNDAEDRNRTDSWTIASNLCEKSKFVLDSGSSEPSILVADNIP